MGLAHCFSINISSDEGGEKKAEGGGDKTKYRTHPYFNKINSAVLL